MRLVINADDFGLSDGVCNGILQAMRLGRVSSTSAMLCVPGSVERLAAAVDALAGRVGVHCQLTNGEPCLPPDAVPTLVGGEGRFPLHAIGDVSAAEVESEWRAQIDRFLGLGLYPTHLDSHHHVHRQPALTAILAELARELGAVVRGVDPAMTFWLRAQGVRCADTCERSWFRRDPTFKGLASVLTRAAAQAGSAAVVELMCHPGVVDDALRARSRYVAERELELAALCSDELPSLLERLGITIVPMSALQ